MHESRRRANSILDLCLAAPLVAFEAWLACWFLAPWHATYAFAPAKDFELWLLLYAVALTPYYAFRLIRVVRDPERDRSRSLLIQIPWIPIASLACVWLIVAWYVGTVFASETVPGDTVRRPEPH